VSSVAERSDRFLRDFSRSVARSADEAILAHESSLLTPERAYRSAEDRNETSGIKCDVRTTATFSMRAWPPAPTSSVTDLLTSGCEKSGA
jgi:hypothetical protein